MQAGSASCAGRAPSMPPCSVRLPQHGVAGRIATAGATPQGLILATALHLTVVCWLHLWGRRRCLGSQSHSHARGSPVLWPETSLLPVLAVARCCPLHCSSYSPWGKPARKGLWLAMQEGRAPALASPAQSTSGEQPNLLLSQRLDQDRRQWSIPTTLFAFQAFRNSKICLFPDTTSEE